MVKEIDDLLNHCDIVETIQREKVFFVRAYDDGFKDGTRQALEAVKEYIKNNLQGDLTWVKDHKRSK